MSNEFQIVYILTNPSMPNLIKIGVTGQSDVEGRMKQLYTSGVPVPFECHFAYRVENAFSVEKTLHYAFGDSRVNPNREFFKVAPDRVVAVLKLVLGEEVTLQVNQELTSETTVEDRESGERLKKSRRPNLNFNDLDIPVGSILRFRDGPIEVTVVSDRKVDYEGEPLFLTGATIKILGLEEGAALQPSPYWTFQGRRLDDLYEEFHSGEEAA